MKIEIIKDDTVSDGEGGFHPAGHHLEVEDDTAASLIEKGLAEEVSGSEPKHSGHSGPKRLKGGQH